MSDPSSDPIWLHWHEPEVADLSDAEVEEYVAYWRTRGDHYRRQRAAVDKYHPQAYRWGYSGWWCSKRESIGLREIERRRIRRERGERE